MGVEHRHGRRRTVGAAGSVMSAAAVALLAGCSASPQAPAEGTTQTTDSDGWVWEDQQAEDAPDASLQALIAQQAKDIEAYQNSGQEEALNSMPELVLDAPPTRQERLQNGQRSAVSMAGDGAVDVVIDEEQAAQEPGDEIRVEPEPVISRSARIAQLSAELAGLLKEEALEQNDPARPLIAAALLESVATGVIDEIDLPGGGPLMLTEAERESLQTIRRLALRLAGHESDLGGDPQRIREVLLDSAENLREHARVRIGTTELCTRAPGFGNYVPLPRHTFLAGRTNRVVVYAEVEHFGLRPATSSEAMLEGDTVAAELTQELELYLRSGDPKPTWQRRIEWLPRTSRRSFRDLFLASAIELPSTLTVGEYDLKVRVIDDVTGAQDEAVIPIRLVADASALDGEPSTPADNTPQQGSDSSSILVGSR